MTVERLRQVAAPPALPSGNGASAAWQDIERVLGLQLPTDYRDLITAYGVGEFANFIYVYSPFASDGYMNLLSQRELNLAAYKSVRAEAPQSAPYPAYPEPGGVLPWAHTENGDVLYWLTEGPPESWPIVVIASRHASYQKYELQVTEFLAQVIEGSLRVRGFPADLLEHVHPPFVPLAAP